MVAVRPLAGNLDLDCKYRRYGYFHLLLTFSAQVAPILIWRAWNIRDTMGWRTQTIGCCISKYVNYRPSSFPELWD